MAPPQFLHFFQQGQGESDPGPVEAEIAVQAQRAACACQAQAGGQSQTVQWNCVSGRAQYTNFGPDTVVIQPLGVRLHGGHTLAVSWAPGAAGRGRPAEGGPPGWPGPA